jgi:hypothetical protein
MRIAGLPQRHHGLVIILDTVALRTGLAPAQRSSYGRAPIPRRTPGGCRRNNGQQTGGAISSLATGHIQRHPAVFAVATLVVLMTLFDTMVWALAR